MNLKKILDTHKGKGYNLLNGSLVVHDNRMANLVKVRDAKLGAFRNVKRKV